MLISKVKLERNVIMSLQLAIALPVLRHVEVFASIAPFVLEAEISCV